MKPLSPRAVAAQVELHEIREARCSAERRGFGAEVAPGEVEIAQGGQREGLRESHSARGLEGIARRVEPREVREAR